MNFSSLFLKKEKYISETVPEHSTLAVDTSPVSCSPGALCGRSGPGPCSLAMGLGTGRTVGVWSEAWRGVPQRQREFSRVSGGLAGGGQRGTGARRALGQEHGTVEGGRAAGRPADEALFAETRGSRRTGRTGWKRVPQPTEQPAGL